MQTLLARLARIHVGRVATATVAVRPGVRGVARAGPLAHDFDKVAEVISGGNASTLSLNDSTEAHQF